MREVYSPKVSGEKHRQTTSVTPEIMGDTEEETVQKGHGNARVMKERVAGKYDNVASVSDVQTKSKEVKVMDHSMQKLGRPVGKEQGAPTKDMSSKLPPSPWGSPVAKSLPQSVGKVWTW